MGRPLFSSADRKLDFDLWTIPCPDKALSAVLGDCMATEIGEKEMRKKIDREHWEKKVVVNDISFHTYRYKGCVFICVSSL